MSELWLAEASLDLVRRVRRAGISVTLYAMVGFPSETAAEAAFSMWPPGSCLGLPSMEPASLPKATTEPRISSSPSSSIAQSTRPSRWASVMMRQRFW